MSSPVGETLASPITSRTTGTMASPTAAPDRRLQGEDPPVALNPEQAPDTGDIARESHRHSGRTKGSPDREVVHQPDRESDDRAAIDPTDSPGSRDIGEHDLHRHPERAKLHEQGRLHGEEHHADRDDPSDPRSSSGTRSRLKLRRRLVQDDTDELKAAEIGR